MRVSPHRITLWVFTFLGIVFVGHFSGDELEFLDSTSLGMLLMPRAPYFGTALLMTWPLLFPSSALLTTVAQLLTLLDLPATCENGCGFGIVIIYIIATARVATISLMFGIRKMVPLETNDRYHLGSLATATINVTMVPVSLAMFGLGPIAVVVPLIAIIPLILVVWRCLRRLFVLAA